MSGLKTMFSVSLYPGGRGYTTEHHEPPARIYFNSKEEKVKYVEGERKFCTIAYAEFNGAFTNSQREEKRIEWLKRRSIYATKEGYAPSMNDQSVWIYRPPMTKQPV